MPVLDTERESLEALLSNPLNRIVAHCSKANIPIDADTIALADLVESDFPGYAPIVLEDWTYEEMEDEFYAEAVSPVLTWESANVVTPQYITAVYMTNEYDGGPPVLLQPFVLPRPFLVNGTEQQFSRQIRYASSTPTE